MSLIELKKRKDPEWGTARRNKYHVLCTYRVGKTNSICYFKVDTGADYTVIGLDTIQEDSCRDLILNSNLPDARFCTASGEVINAKSFVVKDFMLAPEVIIPEIKLHFAESLGKRALLGMDILSLFNFQYIKDVGTHNGTFWLNDPEDSIKELEKYKLNNDISYIDPDTLWSLEKSNALNILNNIE